VFPSISSTIETWLRTAVWKVYAALFAGALAQASPLAAMIPHPEQLLLGTNQLLLVPLVPVVMTVCIALVCICAAVLTWTMIFLAFCLRWTGLLRFPR
jgi:hypothetical protein